MLDQPLERDLDVMREQRDLQAFTGFDSTLTNWAQSNKSELENKEIFFEMFSNDELKKRAAYVLKTVLLKHFLDATYEEDNM